MKKYLKFNLLFVIFFSCQAENKNLTQLQGNWGESKSSNVDFTIKDKKIIYFEDPDDYEIEVIKDSIIITQEKELITKYKIIFISNERLELKPEEGKIIKLLKI
jgi:hypothetical protein